MIPFNSDITWGYTGTSFGKPITKPHQISPKWMVKTIPEWQIYYGLLLGLHELIVWCPHVQWNEKPFEHLKKHRVWMVW